MVKPRRNGTPKPSSAAISILFASHPLLLLLSVALPFPFACYLFRSFFAVEFRNKSTRNVNREAQLIRNISKKEVEENSQKSYKTSRKTEKERETVRREWTRWLRTERMRRGAKGSRTRREREVGVGGGTRLVLRGRERMSGWLVRRDIKRVGRLSFPVRERGGMRVEFTPRWGETVRSFARQRTRTTVVVHKRYQAYLHILEG